MRTHNLVAVFTPGEIADLAARVDLPRVLPGQGIPKNNPPIRGAAAGGERAVVVGRPGDRLHGGGVFAELEERVRGEFVPHEKLIVVAARGELVAFWIPF